MTGNTRCAFGSSMRSFFFQAVNVIGIAAVCALPALVVCAGSAEQGAARTTDAILSWPSSPPAQICGDATLLSGPSAPPAGALVVPAGDNETYDFDRPGATFWFAPGVHTLGAGEFGQIISRDNTSYIGAPGAIIDGQHLNHYAFTSQATNVAIRYLTIRNFGIGGFDNQSHGVVNHDAGDGWLIEYNTIIANDGAGVFIGSNNVVRYNCLKDNGQYGFSAYRPQIEGASAIHDIVVDHNEITGNNADDWEVRSPDCGCSGGGKFWDVTGARVTNNWVHHNKGVGLWADTNNIDFLFEDNFINDNDGEGIWYEISYNATIRSNTFLRNGWLKGATDLGSPAPAIYLSESGGDTRLAAATSGAAKIRVYGNYFEDNFSGISIAENANRFCNSRGNTSTPYCTPHVAPTRIPEPYNDDYLEPISDNHPCYTQIAEEPYRSNCRWHSQNIEVNNNEFYFDPAVVPCAGILCGVQALIAGGADNQPWSPYTVTEIQNDVMFNGNNRFYDNHYYGPWRFATGYGNSDNPPISFVQWQASPFGQDQGSTSDQSETVPTQPGNAVDDDTATMENSAGKWTPWYSADIAATTVIAHEGTRSLEIRVTAPYGWGVNLSNYPGFPTTPGNKSIGLWARKPTAEAALGQATLTIQWLGADHVLLQTNVVLIPHESSWERAAADVEAPTGTRFVFLSITGSDDAGAALYVDDVVIRDAAP